MHGAAGLSISVGQREEGNVPGPGELDPVTVMASVGPWRQQVTQETESSVPPSARLFLVRALYPWPPTLLGLGSRVFTHLLTLSRDLPRAPLLSSGKKYAQDGGTPAPARGRMSLPPGMSLAGPYGVRDALGVLGEGPKQGSP